MQHVEQLAHALDQKKKERIKGMVIVVLWYSNDVILPVISQVGLLTIGRTMNRDPGFHRDLPRLLAMPADRMRHGVHESNWLEGMLGYCKSHNNQGFGFCSGRGSHVSEGSLTELMGLRSQTS